MAKTPARIASLYLSVLLSESKARARRNGVRAGLVAAACGAVLLAGCSVGGGGVSSGLQPGGGGGLLSFESTTMPDGVAGRTYSKVAVTSVLASGTTHYPISPALVSGTFPVASCTVSAGTLPAGMSPALTIDSTGAGCIISGTPTAAGTFNFTIQALDSNSPPRAASQSFTLRIRPEFAATAPPADTANVFVPGVKGRSYGMLSATATQITTTLGPGVGNPPMAANGCSLSVAPSNPGLSIAIAGTSNCLISGNSMSTAGTFALTATITDSPILDPETNLTAVPAKMLTALSSASLAVNAPLTLTAPAGLATAADNRSYGTGGTCSGGACLPASFAVSGGLGGYLANANVINSPGSWSCPLVGSAYNCSTTSVVASGPFPATQSLSISTADTQNAATPASSAATDPASTGSVGLNVAAPLTLTAPTIAASAVTGRSFGQGSTCSPTPACAALPYTVSGGLGTYATNATVVSAPGTWACALSGTTYNCSSASVTASSPFPATPNLSITAADAANASVPVGTSNTATFALTVNGPLTVAAPTSPAVAGNGRPYGANASVPNPSVCGVGGASACAPASFAVSGGNASYAASPVITASPGTWVCPLSGTNYACASAAVVVTGPFPVIANLGLNTADSANQSTPSGSSNTATVALTVVGPVALAPPGSSPVAVNGRAYGQGTNCAPSTNCTGLSYAVSGGLGAYAPAATVVSAPGTWTCTLGGSAYSCASGSVSATGPFPGSSTLSVMASDLANASTPAVASNTANFSLTVNGPLTVTAPTTAAPGVTGRSYGQGSVCSPSACAALPYTVSGGLGGYAANATVVSAPGTWSCTLASATYNCSSASVSSAGPFPATPNVSITATDTANQSTPVGTSNTASFGLTVDGAITLTAPSSAASAVMGRSYGQGSTCSPTPACAPLPYTVSGGLGSYSANATVVSAPGAWICPLAGTTYNCASASVTGTGPFPATPNVSITATDVANASAPLGTSNTATFSLTESGPLTVTPPTSPAAAANGRAYGANASITNPPTCGVSGTLACLPASFAVSGGTPPYAPSPLSIPASPGTWMCPLNGTNYDCATALVSATGPFPISAPLTLNVTDSANQSAPAVTTFAAATATIQVVGPVTLAAPVGLPTAVNQRGYGSNGLVIDTHCGSGSTVCLPASFTASGGLGSYAATPTIVVAPGTWQCPLTGTIYNCATNTVSPTGPVPGPASLTLTASDIPNASTPSGTSSQSTATLTVNSVMTIAPSGTAPDTVTNRAYGTTNNCLPGPVACQPIHYTASNGLGLYTAGTLALGSGIPDTLPCSVAAAIYSCSTAKINSAPTTGVALNMTANESGNLSTPTGTATDSSKSINVLTGVSVTPNLGATWPNGVQNRSYATGAQLQFTAANGIGPYVFPVTVPGSFPTGFNCTPSGAILTCSSASVTGVGPFSPQMSVQDTGNASTPPSTTTSDPASQNTSSLTIANPITVSLPGTKLPNGLVNFPYPTVSNTSTFQATGGLGGYSWVAAPSTACTVTLNGNLPTGLALGSGTAAITGTPTAASATTTDFSFDVCASDTANTTTPSGNGITNFTLNVIDTLAYVTEPASDRAESINTSSQALATHNPITLDTGGAPYAAAVSPSGGVAYFTEPGTNQLVAVNTITGAKIGSSITLPTTPSACAPHGVLATKLLVFIACAGNNTVIALDATNLSATPVASISTASAPEQLAIRADGLRVYVTLPSTNQLFVIDNSVSPPVQLTGGTITNPLTLQITNGTEPFSIAVVPNSASGDIYAYISKQEGTATSDGVDIVSGLATDNFANSSTINTGTNPTPSVPSFVAATPDNNRIYVSLNSTGAVAVIDNTIANPTTQITGSPFSLVSGANPTGLTIPVLNPVPGTGVRVYIAQSGKSNVAIYDNSSTPAPDGTPTVTVGPTTSLNGMASIPPPQ